LTALLLSLGPVLKVGGRHFPSVPMLHAGPTPDHMVDALMLSLAVLVSHGTARVFPDRVQQTPSLILALASISLVVGLESIPAWPFPTSSAAIPDTVRTIGLDGRRGALLYPGMDSKDINEQALYYQTVVPRPLVGGRIHATSAQQTSWTRTVLSLLQSPKSGGDIVPVPTAEDRVSWLQQLGVDYVMSPTGETSEAKGDDAIRRLLEPAGWVTDDLQAFRVPSTVSPASKTHLYTLAAGTWHGPERVDGIWERRLREEQDGLLHLYAPQDERGSLQIDIESALEAPVLEVHLEERSERRRLDSFVVGGRVTCNTGVFTLTQGMNTFRLHAPEEYREAPGDPSLTEAFAFRQISFVPACALPARKGISIGFGDLLRLRGWSLSAPASGSDDELIVTLQWEKVADLGHRHVSFVHLFSPRGDLVDQVDSPLVERDTVAYEWPMEAIRTYQARLKLPRDWRTGGYRVLVGVYLWPDLERLPVMRGTAGSEIDVLSVPLRVTH